ncbi:hypothetical protein D3C84_638440 [compost metagenome]
MVLHFKTLEPKHRLFGAIGGFAVAQLDGVVAGVVAIGAFGQVAGQGETVQFDQYRRLIFGNSGQLQAVHVAIGLDLLRLGAGRDIHLQTGKLHAGFVVQGHFQWQQFQGAVGGVVVAYIHDTLERRGVLGGGEPFFGERRLFQFVVTGGHDRQPLQRHQARERQRTVFNVIDEQQFHRGFAEHFAFTLEAIVGGAAEHMTFQRDQLQRCSALVADQRGLQLLVGIHQGSVQHPLDPGAGKPGTASADCTNGDNNSQKHAC